MPGCTYRQNDEGASLISNPMQSGRPLSYRTYAVLICSFPCWVLNHGCRLESASLLGKSDEVVERTLPPIYLLAQLAASDIRLSTGCTAAVYS